MEEVRSRDKSEFPGSLVHMESTNEQVIAAFWHCIQFAVIKEDSEDHVGRQAAEREVYRTVYLQTKVRQIVNVLHNIQP